MRKSEYKAGAFLVDGSGHVFIHDGYIGFVLNDNCTPAWSFTALMKVLRSLRCNCRDLGVHYNCIPNVFCVGFNYKDSCDSHTHMHMEGDPFETMVRAIEYLHRVMMGDLREMLNKREGKKTSQDWSGYALKYGTVVSNDKSKKGNK